MGVHCSQTLAGGDGGRSETEEKERPGATSGRVNDEFICSSVKKSPAEEIRASAPSAGDGRNKTSRPPVSNTTTPPAAPPQRPASPRLSTSPTLRFLTPVLPAAPSPLLPSPPTFIAPVAPSQGFVPHLAPPTSLVQPPEVVEAQAQSKNPFP